MILGVILYPLQEIGALAMGLTMEITTKAVTMETTTVTETLAAEMVTVRVVK